MTDSGLTTCGHCGRTVVRLKGVKRLRAHGELGDEKTPILFSRTLVHGLMVPSCSIECAGVLRRMAQEAQR